MIHSKTDPSGALYALGHQRAAEDGGSMVRDVLLVSKSDKPMSVQLGSDAAGATAQVLEAAGVEPGFAPPL